MGLHDRYDPKEFPGECQQPHIDTWITHSNKRQGNIGTAHKMLADEAINRLPIAKPFHQSW